jgi:hypothetical protein
MSIHELLFGCEEGKHDETTTYHRGIVASDEFLAIKQTRAPTKKRMAEA